MKENKLSMLRTSMIDLYRKRDDLKSQLISKSIAITRGRMTGDEDIADELVSIEDEIRIGNEKIKKKESKLLDITKQLQVCCDNYSSTYCYIYNDYRTMQSSTRALARTELGSIYLSLYEGRCPALSEKLSRIISDYTTKTKNTVSELPASVIKHTKIRRRTVPAVVCPICVPRQLMLFNGNSYYCAICGAEEEYMQAPKKSSSKTYQPISKRKEHFYTWLDRLQAGESWSGEYEDSYQKVVNYFKVRKQFDHEGGPVASKLTPEDIRICFQDCDLSILNPHVILFFSKLVGRRQPIIEAADREILYSDFEKLQVILSKLDPKNTRKYKYYPHTIGKLIQNRFGIGGGKYRDIVLSVHRQSNKTIEKNNAMLASAFRQLGWSFVR